MGRTLTFFVFFGVALTLAGLLHYYVWARLVRDTQLSSGMHRAMTVVIVVLFVSVPLTFYFGRTRPLETMRPFLLGAYVWMGLLFLTVVLLGITDLGRLVHSMANRWLADGNAVDPERRQAMSRMLGAGVAVMATSMGAFATHSGLTRLMIREVKVPLARLPKALSGLTIAQLSDVHVGPTIRREFIEQVVARTNALAPDVIAITGDLVDGSVEQLREHVEPLRDLKAKYGVYFVTGNHEYYSGAEAWCQELTRLGIKVLRNERVSIGEGDASFDLAGIDDWSAARFGRGHGADLEKALAGRDASRELVLLAHQPRAIFEAEKAGVGLQLSGHTHGGQMWPWNIFVRLQQPVVSGLEQLGQSLIYVSNGTGYWGPPMRLGAPAEITRVVLHARDT